MRRKKKEIKQHIASLNDIDSAVDYYYQLETCEEKGYALQAIRNKFHQTPEELLSGQNVLKEIGIDNCYDSILAKQRQRERTISHMQKTLIESQNDVGDDDDGDDGLSPSTVPVN